MTDYIPITDGETDPSAPLTSSLAKRWRDNPIAIAEGASGAPVIAGGGWHPIDANTIGGPASGVIYDTAVDGNVAAIDSPDFEDGFEYAFYVEGLRFAGGTSPGVTPQLYISGAYRALTASNLVAVTAGGNLRYLWIEISAPRVVKPLHGGSVIGFVATERVTDSTLSTIGGFSAAKAERLRLSHLGGSGATIGGGNTKVYMYRRGFFK